MMSLEAIVYVNSQIAARAAEEALEPYAPSTASELDYWPPFPFPNLGHFEPDNWARTDTTFFVDKTGVGSSDEPALTTDQFKRALRAYIAENPGHAFAITEEGEFQAIISAFRRIN